MKNDKKASNMTLYHAYDAIARFDTENLKPAMKTICRKTGFTPNEVILTCGFLQRFGSDQWDDSLQPLVEKYGESLLERGVLFDFNGARKASLRGKYVNLTPEFISAVAEDESLPEGALEREKDTRPDDTEFISALSVFHSLFQIPLPQPTLSYLFMLFRYLDDNRHLPIVRTITGLASDAAEEFVLMWAIHSHINEEQPEVDSLLLSQAVDSLFGEKMDFVTSETIAFCGGNTFEHPCIRGMLDLDKVCLTRAAGEELFRNLR